MVVDGALAVASAADQKSPSEGSEPDMDHLDLDPFGAAAAYVASAEIDLASGLASGLGSDRA